MPREYRYRTVRLGRYAVPIEYGPHLVALWCVVAGALVIASMCITSLQEGLSEPLITLVVGWVVVALLVGLSFWLLHRRVAGVAVSVDKECLIYKSRTGEKHIPFDDITELRSPLIPYLNGWVKIVSGHDVIRLTIFLEDIGDFLEELKAALDSRGLSDRYDRAKLARFLKTASFYEPFLMARAVKFRLWVGCGVVGLVALVLSLLLFMLISWCLRGVL
ncbi:MAG TPA: hypothetical protein HPP77_09885 [Candidatus Hydrogenedentes bacterium]|nr:hypothetical protein [Candidatus Hydrogenedentota bacterium]HIJ73233.1 hypothetical protein [Candidatus Hydrogenedentota bacterium]